MTQLKGTAINGALLLDLGGGNFKSLIDLIFPVGICIYLSKSVNPNSLYPNTTWELIKGKVIIGYDEDDASFNTIDKTGGEKEHTLTTSEMPSHQLVKWASGSGSDYSGDKINSAMSNGAALGSNGTAYSNHSGSGKSHNNLPPYTVKYIWERTS